MASSLAHSAGPAMVAISQPSPSTSTEVGIPSARPDALKILKNLGFWVAEIAEPGQIGLFQKILRFFGVAGVDIDGDHLEIRCRRAWFAGSRAPASPCGRARTRWPTDSPARCFRASRRAFGLAFGVLEGEVRQPQRRGRHGQRGHLAMRQRGELARKLDRTAAGGIAGRAALQPANPIYPGKSDQPPRSAPPRWRWGSGAWRPGRGEGRSGISFVILYQIRLCRAGRWSSRQRRFAGWRAISGKS